MTVPSTAPQPGPRADRPPLAGPLAAAGRLAGFLLLAGLGLAILAGLVLLPAWTRLAWTRYERDGLAATVRDEQAAAAALHRMIDRVDTDPVLNKRLAMSELGLRPVNEVVVIDDGLAPALPPGAIVPPRHPRPAPPPAWLTQAATRIAHPPTRRGLYLMAVCALLAAALLFGPPKARPAGA